MLKNSNNIKKHYRTCCLCEAMCGLVIEHDEGLVSSIKADADDVFSKGHICPKAVALQDIHNDPDRLREPLRRTSTGWETIDWATALDEVAAKLKATRDKYGADSVATYLGNPNAHHYDTLLFVDPLLKAIASKNRYSVLSTDYLPHGLACSLLFGNQLFFPVPDIDHTDFFLCIGANPVVSGGSLMSAPGMAKRIKALKQRGGQLVVIDPRKTETAKLADKHLFIRPAGDVWLLLGVINVLFDNDLVAYPSFIKGLDEFKQAISPFSLEQAAQHSGISEDDIESLALSFSKAKSAIAYGRVGTCTQAHGTLTAWLICVLNILTGNLDRVGGVMFPLPAVDLAQLAKWSGNTGHFAASESRVHGLPTFSGEYSVVSMADEMLTQGDEQVKALLCLAGNPVLSIPNGEKLDRALEGLDFIVSIDYYINETSRHADIILPPAGPLERPHYSLGVHAAATRNTAKYSPALFRPKDNALQEWQILLELSTRLGSRSYLQTFTSKLQYGFFNRLGADGVLDLLLRLGPYGSLIPGVNKVNLATLKKSPHGVDYGALKPCLPDKLFTQDKSIQLLHPVYAEGLNKLAASINKPVDKQFNLLLIGRRDLRSNNSWMHNSRRLVKGKPRCSLHINPSDAERLNISDGQTVTLSSRVGSGDIVAEVSDRMMEGVVSMPHGWGHRRQGVQLSVAEQTKGISMNDLTDETAFDRLSGVAILNGIPVSVATK